MSDGKRKQNNGKRPAHVKWDGKTIALGTFPAEESEIICKRAKALTKEWRSKMHPKPSVEWVKHALEQENVRVVNDRPGRTRKNKNPSAEEGRRISDGQKPINELVSGDDAFPTNVSPTDDDQRLSNKRRKSQSNDPNCLEPKTAAKLAEKYPLRDQDVDSTLAMLKIHHSNLVSEIDETTVLIDFYKEQQLKRRAEGQHKEGGEQVQFNPIEINQVYKEQLQRRAEGQHKEGVEHHPHINQRQVQFNPTELSQVSFSPSISRVEESSPQYGYSNQNLISDQRK